MTGRTLSHFEVLEKLGEGGMGVVYKARDTALNRFVALKLLPPGKVADPERRRRFVQEARAASALSHANIVTIYEISQAENADFIAMEYVAGRTLDRVIPRGGMKLPDALRIAIQVADGLACAHAAGIVHRDLKPSNIIVGDAAANPAVKILDFGLAKLTESASHGPEDATLTETRMSEAVRTNEGTLLGTVAYMSPEQAEGKTVNACTDIFAFGAVLYEMLSGRRAFAGATRQATLAAVLRDEPPPIAGIPHELEKLIARCLRKDPARRAQHMADLKLTLDELKEESESGISGAPAARSVPAKRSRLILALAGTAAVILGAGILWWSARSQPERAAPEMQAVVLTSYPGQVGAPALSPDGKQVAFSWTGEKNDNQDIYVKLADAGTPVRLTTDSADDSFPSWSPDGRYLAFVRLTREGTGAYYVIPALGGAERKIADIPRLPSHRPLPSVDWTPDSKSLVMVDTGAEPPALAQVSVADGGKTRLTSPAAKSFGDFLPAVSPDGRWLVFAHIPDVSLQEWKVIPFHRGPSSQAPLPLMPSQEVGFRSARCAWAADSAHLVCAEWPSGGPRLVRLPVAGAEKTTPIAAAGTDVGMPSIARQGGRLAFSHSFQNQTLWRADLRDPHSAPVRLIASTRTDMQPDYSPDGSRIAFVSTRSGTREVWTANADGTNPVQITTRATLPTAPRWSPDGRRIAFAQRPGGNVDVYVVDAQGGTPRRMTTDPGGDASAYWSRDGRWIYFASNRTGREEVWKILADGSAPEIQVTRNGGWRSREALDGKLLYYQKFDLPGLFRIPIGGGSEEKVADVAAPEDWQLAPGKIYYFRRSGDECIVVGMDLDSSGSRDVVKLPAGALGGTANFTVSPDGRWLVFVRTEQLITELMMIDNFR